MNSGKRRQQTQRKERDLLHDLLFIVTVSGILGFLSFFISTL